MTLLAWYLIQRDRKRGHIAGHDIGGRVAYEDYIDAGAVYQQGCGVIVCCKHTYFFAASLHLCQACGGDFSFVVYCIG